MPEHRDPDFLVDALLDLDPELLRHPSEALVPELVDSALTKLHRALSRLRTFGHYADEVRIAAHEALFDQPTHLFDVVRLLGDQRHVGTGCQAGIQCDPSGVAAH